MSGFVDWGAIAQASATMASAHANYVQNQQVLDQQERFHEDSLSMANSAHQREVRDLMLAGLNPILSATGGSGAPIGLGGGGHLNAIPDIGAGIGSALATKRENEKLRATIDNIDADSDLKDWNSLLIPWEIERKRSEIALNHSLDNSAKENASKIHAEKIGQDWSNLLQSYRAPGFRTEAGIDESPWGNFTRFINRLNPFTAQGLARDLGK